MAPMSGSIPSTYLNDELHVMTAISVSNHSNANMQVMLQDGGKA